MNSKQDRREERATCLFYCNMMALICWICGMFAANIQPPNSSAALSPAAAAVRSQRVGAGRRSAAAGRMKPSNAPASRPPKCAA